ncbi:hypothetical protein NAP1_04850 [Erythrobacter sp. NAP1]|nr:hypothetical protein NAP1_04850 [Erythrobacter sp. NAP1]
MAPVQFRQLIAGGTLLLHNSLTGAPIMLLARLRILAPHPGEAVAASNFIIDGAMPG